MIKDYTKRNLRGVSFKHEDLTDASFSGSDLRGADFTDSNLKGADFREVKTGITPGNTLLIFLIALIVSAISGYVAMLAGQTIQTMFASRDLNVRNAGIACTIIIILFIIFSIWKGVDRAVKYLILPVVVLAAITGIISYVSGAGTGMGIIYLILALLLVVVMFVVGTVARAAAGALSNILFLVVALFGAFFGRSLGGGIGTVVMAISCMIISKRALKGVSGFRRLRRVAMFITKQFGTSFRNSNLADANFSRTKIHNADFSQADISLVHWGNSKKINCIID